MLYCSSCLVVILSKILKIICHCLLAVIEFKFEVETEIVLL